MSELVKPIPEGIKHDWTVKVDGQLVQAHHVVFENLKFGQLSFGLRPEGTIGWIWHEASGGGQGVVPYSVIDDELYVGLVQEERPTLSRLSWNIPRGFINPGETHFEGAKREFREEVGDLSRLGLEELLGLPANSNSTFFDTSTEREGFIFFGLEIPNTMLVCNEDLEVPRSYKFKDDAIKPLSKTGEKIIWCLFFPWFIASEYQDTFTGTGILRLLNTHRHLINYLRS